MAGCSYDFVPEGGRGQINGGDCIEDFTIKSCSVTVEGINVTSIFQGLWTGIRAVSRGKIVTKLLKNYWLMRMTFYLYSLLPSRCMTLI